MNELRSAAVQGTIGTIVKELIGGGGGNSGGGSGCGCGCGCGCGGK